MPRIQSIQELRKGLGSDADNYTDEDLVMALSSATGLDPAKTAARFGYDENKGPWTERASASIDQYQAGLYGVGEAVGKAVGSTGMEAAFAKRRRANDISAKISGQRAQEGGIPANWDEVNGVGSAAKYVGGLAIDSAPYIAESLVGGVAGRMLVGGAELASGASLAAKAARAKEIERAGVAGATAASYPSSVADVLQNQREQAGTTDLGSAAALGVPYAALNTFGLSELAAKGKLPRIANSALDDIGGFKGGVARAGATGAGLALSEGASETGQEMANQLGRMSVDPNAQFMSEDARKRYVDSFIGGAALGGVFGAGGGGWRRSSDVMEGAHTPIDQPVEDAPQDILQLGYNPLAGVPRVFADGTMVLGSEQELAYRTDPRAANMMPYGPATAEQQPGNSMDFEPADILSMAGNEPRPGLQMPGMEFNRFEGVGDNLTADQGRLQNVETNPAQNFDTGNLSYEGQPSNNVSMDRSGLPLALVNPGEENRGQPAAVPYSYDTGSLALAPQGQTADQAPAAAGGPAQQTLPTPTSVQSGPSTPQAAAKLAETQKLTSDAKDMVGRAQEAGMTSEKQQTTFWRAEKMKDAGQIDDGTLTQVIALLMQSKYAKANKVLDEAAQPTAAAEVTPAPAKAAEVAPSATTTTTSNQAQATPALATEEVQIGGVNKSQPTPVAAAPTQAGPAPATGTIESTPSAPTTLAQRVQATAERAGKIRRLEALLSCLTSR